LRQNHTDFFVFGIRYALSGQVISGTRYLVNIAIRYIPKNMCLVEIETGYAENNRPVLCCKNEFIPLGLRDTILTRIARKAASKTIRRNASMSGSHPINSHCGTLRPLQKAYFVSMQ